MTLKQSQGDQLYNENVDPEQHSIVMQNMKNLALSVHKAGNVKLKGGVFLCVFLANEEMSIILNMGENEKIASYVRHTYGSSQGVKTGIPLLWKVYYVRT